MCKAIVLRDRGPPDEEVCLLLPFTQSFGSAQPGRIVSDRSGCLVLLAFGRVDTSGYYRRRQRWHPHLGPGGGGGRCALPLWLLEPVMLDTAAFGTAMSGLERLWVSQCYARQRPATIGVDVVWMGTVVRGLAVTGSVVRLGLVLR